MARIASVATSVAAAVLVCACAGTAPGGRSQLTAPAPFSSVYSSIGMNLKLATTANVDNPCSGLQCQVERGFEQQVQRIGGRLAESAYEATPELKARIPAFTFVVADKSEAGSASDAGGTIVIYRGVHNGRLNEEALAFIIAREMGHVIARHHDEKSAATMLASLLAQILLPVVNLARGSMFLASSAASAVGSRIMTADSDPHQAKEARDIAIGLLGHQGWAPAEVADSVASYAEGLGNDEWPQGLKNALVHLQTDIRGT